MRNLVFLFTILVLSLVTNAQKAILDFSTYQNSSFNTHNNCNVFVKEPGIFIEIDEKGKSTVSFPASATIADDLSPFSSTGIKVSNIGSKKCRVAISLIESSWINSSVVLSPGECKELKINLSRKTKEDDKYFPGMNGVPRGTLARGKSLAAIKNISVEIYSEGKTTVVLSDMEGIDPYISPAEIAAKKDFFPFIDKYGQYIFGEWPGKVSSDKELKDNLRKEKAEFLVLPLPTNFDKFGGWENGPTLKATGHFRVEKYNGKWWFVDPKGKLFWSHGPTCVSHVNGVTPLNDREYFFKEMPLKDSEYSFCFSERGNISTFNFTSANLYRKYGEEWKEKCTEHINNRFRSWGMNTFANWSDPEIYLNGSTRTPYTATINSGGPRLDGANKKFPDPFDPAFIKSLDENTKQIADKTKEDPYCIGYFVDNELNVQGLAAAALRQDKNGFAKTEFLKLLKSKYSNIRNLNDAWLTNFRNWGKLEIPIEVSTVTEKDSREFERILVDKYYSECAKAVKKYAPDILYMGSRLHCHYYPDDKHEQYIIEIASRYCDVVSFNRYRFIAEDLILPSGIDKPIIIGEFHFGALDRGYFHTGLRGVANQQQRAEAYQDYLEGALRNPQIVGAHWFQYGGQAFTGRFDGENYQIGILDICDNPYPEFIKAIRNIGYKMYDYRTK